ncbi:MAG: DoxX family membrane protein [Gammaproteobacteria bacterium]|nr:DoxX family membrane protein [Gammaproteobacteria bacterium]
MSALVTMANSLQDILDRFRAIDFLGPLALRLYLAPVFIAVGLHKFMHLEDIASWFGNPDWGLGLPAPMLMAILAASAELFGGLALLFGVAVRWFTIPLMITMLVAIFAVHWDKGWFAIAPGDPATSTAKPLASIGIPAAQRSLENSEEVGRRLQAAKSLLKKHGNYKWLTEKGSFVVLNNGIEFGVTYFVMLLALFFTGAGKYLSVDYWIARQFRE